MRLWVSEAERKTLISSKRSRQREGVLEAALVRDQDREGDAVGPLERCEHLGAVGELRDHVGADERGHLDPLQPGGDQHLDQPHLVGGRDHLRLVLEAVARADLADPDAVGVAGHLRTPAGTAITRRWWVPTPIVRSPSRDLDVEVELAVVDDLGQLRADGAGRTLGGGGRRA